MEKVEALRKHIAELEKALASIIEFKPRTRNQQFEKRAFLCLLHLIAWCNLTNQPHPTLREFSLLLRIHGFRMSNRNMHNLWRDYRNLCLWKLRRIEKQLAKNT